MHYDIRNEKLYYLTSMCKELHTFVKVSIKMGDIMISNYNAYFAYYYLPIIHSAKTSILYKNKIAKAAKDLLKVMWT